MSKEYHLFKTIKTEGKPEQGYVFGVERDHVNKTLEYQELYIFTVVDGVEHKFRIDLMQAMHSMCERLGGSIAPVAIDNVKQQLEKESELQHMQLLAQQHFTNGMLMASDAASKNHLTMSDFNTIDEYLAYLAHKKL
ncbi:hypothetical protein UFOVP623_4 [uncultured Caudovirales phage]|uniref:Uncharacterized protein n=1 Tax=uncultured Caudovirales phage TaxID=2100421 RepID=A0A6J5N2N6_9CAUD|nr:hypothetical protein UFOVP623_4 [uncultured Caudovirales phage]